MSKIVLWPSPILKRVSDKVVISSSDASELPEGVVQLAPDVMKSLVTDMVTTMSTYGGVGLSAIQIDQPLRVVTTLVNGVPLIFVNPKIVSKDGDSQLINEGCLSLPGIFDKVRRFPRVSVEFEAFEGDALKPEKVDAEGLLAQVLQHELDHLDGNMFIDNLPASSRGLIRGDLQKRRREGKLRNYR